MVLESIKVIVVEEYSIELMRFESVSIKPFAIRGRARFKEL